MGDKTESLEKNNSEDITVADVIVVPETPAEKHNANTTSQSRKGWIKQVSRGKRIDMPSRAGSGGK